MAPNITFTLKHLVLDNWHSKRGSDTELFTYSPDATLVMEDGARPVLAAPPCISCMQS